MATGYMEKAEALNAESLERMKVERIARVLTCKVEETARLERRLKELDAEIARLEVATLAEFSNECCDGSIRRF